MASLSQATHGELLALAASGDQTAWNELVDRFGQMVWSIARSFRLDDATAKDVSQTVWLRLGRRTAIASTTRSGFPAGWRPPAAARRFG